MKYNKLLEKQLKKFLNDSGVKNLSGFDAFLESISSTYDTLEKAQKMAERAFEVSDSEYREINNKLQQELNSKKLSIESLHNAVSEISDLSIKEQTNDIVSLAAILNDEVKNRKSAESIFTSLITHLKNGILLEDKNRRIRFANQALGEFFGIPDTAQIKGADCKEATEQVKELFKHPENFKTSIENCINTKEVVLGEAFEMKDGRVFLRDYIPIFTNNLYDGHLWSYTEITESKKKEQLIAENEKRNRLIMNAALDAIITIDVRGLVTFWNPQAESIFGWTQEEALNKRLHELIIPNVHRKAHQEGMKKFMNTGVGPALNQQLELPARHKDGYEISIELYILPIGEGDELFFCSFIRDITSRKQIELEKERLGLVASANENGIVFINGEEKVFWSNNGFEIMTGYQQSEILSQEPLNLIYGPLSNIEDWNLIYKAYRKKQSVSQELILYRKDKSWFWARAKGQSLSPNNEGDNYFFMIEDITEEKEVQNLLNTYKERLKVALNSVGDNYWEHDFKIEETTFFNPTEELLGFDLDQIDSNRADFWWSRVHENDRVVLEELDKEYKAGNRKEHNVQYRVVRKDGTIRWIIDRGTVTEFDAYNLPLKIIGTHIDITNQKQLENDLIIAKDAAESSSRAKEMFLANMSHEIRTPMNAIVGMANQLKKTNLTEKQKFYTQTIESSADSLLVIINDILDLSKIDAGELSLESIGFEPQKVIANVMRVMQYKAEEKGLSFTNSFCDRRMAPVLIGDPYRLNQIFLNLISNAIKFTDKGGVDIQCYMVEDDGETQLMEGRIIDTGVGMELGFIERIFQKFKQEDDSVTRKFGGTGLGMSICKELVELMHGEIIIESEKGKGTTVAFRIPMKKGSNDDLPEKVPSNINLEQLKGKTILVVDDNEMNRLVASTILENIDVQVTEAEDGLQAVKKVKTQVPDLILMDVQMPNMDGIEATKQIRKNHNSNSLPIIGLTALALKGEEAKFQKAGMNDFILKPFQENHLLELISKYLNVNIPSKEKQKHYSLAKLKKLNDSEAFLSKMTNLFVQMSTDSIKEIGIAYKNQDFELVSKLAHKMKPSIDNLEIEVLKSVVREIEQNAINYKKGDQLEELIKTYTQVLSEIIEDIN